MWNSKNECLLIAFLGFPVPDDRAGELPRAYVIRKTSGTLKNDIIDCVRERTAPHKHLAAGCMFVETQ